MIWMEVLLEGVSDVPAVREVLQRKFFLRENEHFRIHPHRGKGTLPRNPLSRPDPKHQGLLDQLPAKLRGFAKSLPTHAVVLVVLDVDGEPCVEVLEKLYSMLDALPVKPRVLFRLAIEETESWFIADIEALKKTYPGQVKSKLLNNIQPDAVIGAWEVLARALGLDPKAVGPSSKFEWAKRIAPHLSLENPCSSSFGKLIQGLERILPQEWTMTIQTDDFLPAPPKRVVSAAPVSPQEEAIERALRPSLAEKLKAFDPAVHGDELVSDAPVGAEFGAGA